MSVNKVILVGNLGADPELRTTASGQEVCNLRMATSETWNDKEGNRQERTEWHSVTVWGVTAGHCARYLSKGRQVYVEGRIQTREYEDRDGNQRKAVDVVASSVVFLSGRDGGADGGGRSGGGGGGGWGSKDGGSKGGGSGGW